LSTGKFLTFLPSGYRLQGNADLYTSVIGCFDDQSCFHEEQDFLASVISRQGTSVIVGFNGDLAQLQPVDPFVSVLSLPPGDGKSYYDTLLLSPGNAPPSAIQWMITRGESPFLFAAVVESAPLAGCATIAQLLKQGRYDQVAEQAALIFVDSFGGDGTVYWMRGEKESQSPPATPPTADKR
jgi:hypothetical protein